MNVLVHATFQTIQTQICQQSRDNSPLRRTFIGVMKDLWIASVLY
ncbi:MAG: hypothetical protein Q9M50_07515 [Methylococcales bacterium]|nr:hypothetical protein [Methylococcales bacterium]